MVRHGLNYVPRKRRAKVAANLKRIHKAPPADEAEQHLGEFGEKWDTYYLPIGQPCRRNWQRIIPFFDFPLEIRKVIYTTNAIESVNHNLRKLTQHRGASPNDKARVNL
jgi:putative transposase